MPWCVLSLVLLRSAVHDDQLRETAAAGITETLDRDFEHRRIGDGLI
jgi:hypothetical protein